MARIEHQIPDVLISPRDWPYIIVTEDAWCEGEKLPPYIGPFSKVPEATAWGETWIEHGKWHITDLATIQAPSSPESDRLRREQDIAVEMQRAEIALAMRESDQ